MNSHRLSVFLSLFVFLFSALSSAATPEWVIVPNESSINFTATQNNSPVNGQFKTFNGRIVFSPDELSSSEIEIKIKTSSISTSYKEIEDTLRSSEWFDEKVFPDAIFQAKQFKKISDKNFEAVGTLTIKNKTLPITLTFSLDEFSATHAKVHGSTQLKRTAFGIGQGEWSNTNDIKDDVKINFVLSANAN